MSPRYRSQLLAGGTLALALLSLILIIGTLSSSAGPASATAGWEPLFSEAFTPPLSGWTISDTLGGAYRWTTVSYTTTVGTLVVTDTGLAVRAPGQDGNVLFPAGNYTNTMSTWAVAGPFVPAGEALGLRLRLQMQNRVAPGDAFFVGLSYDGLQFTGITLTEVITDLQELPWSAPVYTDGLPIWVMLRFTSDEQGVDAGPLVDNLILEINVGHDIYMPLLRREPTPTPTLVPAAAQWFDGFDDPTSGWYVGDAERLNRRLDPERWVWEVVATMRYDDGEYVTYIPLTAHGGGEVDTWFVWPAHAAPLPDALRPVASNYCIEARGVFFNSTGEFDPWWAHWGIVFGANDAFTDIYTFQINANKRWAVIRYPTYVYPGNRSTDHETTIVDWGMTDHPEILSGPQYNTLKIVVRGTNAAFYVNGVEKGSTFIGNFPRQHIGLIAGDWEVTPVDIRFDYFHYDAECPEAH